MSVDRDIDDLLRKVNGDREVLRRKVFALLTVFNDGRTHFRVFGFDVDVLSQFESKLRNMSDDQVRTALRILRE